MESSTEGFLVHELTQLSTDTITHHNKRSPTSPLLYEDTKRPRLEEDDDMETSSRESRWSRYRDCATLSTLTEPGSDTQEEQAQNLELDSLVHISAKDTPDLEDHIDKLAKELEEWSLINLKEWRQQQQAESPQKPKHAAKASRQRQKAAKRNLMRALRHPQHHVDDETMQDT